MTRRMSRTCFKTTVPAAWATAVKRTAPGTTTCHTAAVCRGRRQSKVPAGRAHLNALQPTGSGRAAEGRGCPHGPPAQSRCSVATSLNWTCVARIAHTCNPWSIVKSCGAARTAGGKPWVWRCHSGHEACATASHECHNTLGAFPCPCAAGGHLLSTLPPARNPSRSCFLPARRLRPQTSTRLHRKQTSCYGTGRAARCHAVPPAGSACMAKRGPATNTHIHPNLALPVKCGASRVGETVGLAVPPGQDTSPHQCPNTLGALQCPRAAGRAPFVCPMPSRALLLVFLPARRPCPRPACTACLVLRTALAHSRTHAHTYLCTHPRTPAPASTPRPGPSPVHVAPGVLALGRDLARDQ